MQHTSGNVAGPPGAHRCCNVRLVGVLRDWGPGEGEEVLLRIGLELLTARPYGWSELRDTAVSVEDSGFDSLWVPDHIERTFWEQSDGDVRRRRDVGSDRWRRPRGSLSATTEARIKGIDTHHIPLMIAAQGPKSIDLAFKHGDIWNAVDLSGTPDPSQLAERISVADTASAAHERSVQRSVDLMVSPVPLPGMSDVGIITGSAGEIVEALARFVEAGFNEVHCYGPAPSEIGDATWRTIVDAVHTF